MTRELKDGVIPHWPLHRLKYLPRSRDSLPLSAAEPEPEPPRLGRYWPMAAEQGCEPLITSGYGPRGKRIHRGGDIMLRWVLGIDARGNPVYKARYWCPGPFLSCEAGEVMGGAWRPRENIFRGSSNGWRLWIEGEDGCATGYFHCARDVLVEAGDLVTAGQAIATPAGRHYTWPPHVHLERSNVKWYNPVDPAPFLEGAEMLVAEMLVAS